MSVDKKIEIVRTFITALQSGDMDIATRTSAETFVVTGLFPRPLNRDEFLGVQSELLKSMSDFSYNLASERVVDRVVKATLRIEGMHQHDLALPLFGLQTIPATGLAVALPQVHVVFLVEGEQVGAMDVERVPGGGLEGLLQQVGAELPLAPREDVMDDPMAYQEGRANTRSPDIDKREG